MAARLGGGFTTETIEDLTDEIQRLAPSHRGVSRALLGSRDFRDGVVVPLAEVPAAVEPLATSDVSAHDPAGDTQPMDPTATPGVLEAESQGVPVVAQAPEPPPPIDDERLDPPALLTYEPELAEPVVPPHDAYALRLVSARTLYDHGTLTQRSPSMAALAPEPTVHVNPYDLERLGVRSGGSVRLIGRTRIVVNAVADEGVPRGNAFVPFNTAGLGAADLIDANALANDVRMETP